MRRELTAARSNARGANSNAETERLRPRRNVGEFSRNAKMKRLNPYWVQEQSRASGIHTDNLLKVVRLS